MSKSIEFSIALMLHDEEKRLKYNSNLKPELILDNFLKIIAAELKEPDYSLIKLYKKHGCNVTGYAMHLINWVDYHLITLKEKKEEIYDKA